MESTLLTSVPYTPLPPRKANKYFRNKCKLYMKEKNQKGKANIINHEKFVTVVIEENIIGDDIRCWIIQGLDGIILLGNPLRQSNFWAPEQSKGYSYSDTRIKFASDLESQLHFYLHGQGKRNRLVSSALPETAASMVVTAMAVGAAATLLVRRTRASATLQTDSSMRECEGCGGSGICAECKGEGFVLKKLSDESAARARMLAKDMATRYTAGLPKKWSYCTKCSSSRSCRTCGGTGKISW